MVLSNTLHTLHIEERPHFEMLYCSEYNQKRPHFERKTSQIYHKVYMAQNTLQTYPPKKRSHFEQTIYFSSAMDGAFRQLASSHILKNAHNVDRTLYYSGYSQKRSHFEQTTCLGPARDGAFRRHISVHIMRTLENTKETSAAEYAREISPGDI